MGVRAFFPGHRVEIRHGKYGLVTGTVTGPTAGGYYRVMPDSPWKETLSDEARRLGGWAVLPSRMELLAAEPR